MFSWKWIVNFEKKTALALTTQLKQEKQKTYIDLKYKNLWQPNQK